VSLARESAILELRWREPAQFVTIGPGHEKCGLRKIIFCRTFRGVLVI